MGARQRGHSGFSLHHSMMQFLQIEHSVSKTKEIGAVQCLKIKEYQENTSRIHDHKE